MPVGGCAGIVLRLDQSGLRRYLLGYAHPIF